MAFLSPDHLVEKLYLKDGSRVADVGSGSGAYVVSLARSVGEKGKVYAVDIHRDALHTLHNSLTKAGYLNTDIIWADIEKGIYIEDYDLDAVVLSNVLFQLENIQTGLKEVSRVLKPEGQVLVVDWKDSFSGIGPHPGAVVTESRAEEELRKAGFHVRERLPAGDYHYAFIAIKS